MFLLNYNFKKNFKLTVLRAPWVIFNIIADLSFSEWVHFGFKFSLKYFVCASRNLKSRKFFLYTKKKETPGLPTVSLKCWDAYQRVSPPSEFPDLFTNFHEHRNVFILGRFENFWVFWKAMSLNRSFLHSTSCGVRFWYPFGTHPSRRYWGLVFGSVFDRFWSVWAEIGPMGVPKMIGWQRYSGKTSLWDHTRCSEIFSSIG